MPLIEKQVKHEDTKEAVVQNHDFPETKMEQWFCTQAQARVAGLPSALDKSAKALGIVGKLSTAFCRGGRF